MKGPSVAPRDRQTPTTTMPSSQGSVSHAAMGATTSGAGTSTAAGLDASYWAPNHLDYLGADFRFTRIVISPETTLEYRPLPADITQVFFIFLFFIIIIIF